MVFLGCVMHSRREGVGGGRGKGAITKTGEERRGEGRKRKKGFLLTTS